MALPADALPPPSRRIKELDGLRGVSVLFVVAFHATTYGGYFNPPDAGRLVLGNLGVIGVQIFFIISGFIITHLLMEEHERTGGVSLRGFYTRRFFRIIPAYWIYLLSTLLLAAGGIIVLKDNAGEQAAALVISILFLSDFLYPGWFWAHSWSLSVEEQFYVLFPLCFKLIYRSGHKMLIMTLLLSVVYLSAYFSETLNRAFSALLYAVDSHLNWKDHLDFDRFFSYQYIAVGVLMAFFWRSASLLLGHLPIFIYGVAIIWIILYPLMNPPQAIRALYGHTYALLLASVVGAVVTKPDYFFFLRWRVIQVLGACSYSIYLWQQLFTSYPSHYGSIPLANPVLSIPLLALCVTLSYYFVERKFIRLGRRLSCAPFSPSEKVPEQSYLLPTSGTSDG